MLAEAPDRATFDRFFIAIGAADIATMQAVLADHPGAVHWEEFRQYNALTHLIAEMNTASSGGARKPWGDAAKVLIHAGIDINWYDGIDEENALHLAMITPDITLRSMMITLLVSHGADTYHLAYRGTCPDRMAQRLGQGRVEAIAEGRRLAEAAAPLSIPDLNARLLADTRRKKFVLRNPA